MTRRTRPMWAISTIFCAVACGSASAARAQVVALDCQDSISNAGPVRIVVDYGRSVVETYPLGENAQRAEDASDVAADARRENLPQSIVEGDHFVHAAIITDDYIKWGSVPQDVPRPDMSANALAGFDGRVMSATVDRKTGAFTLVTWPMANGQTEFTGTCTKRSTNKF